MPRKSKNNSVAPLTFSSAWILEALDDLLEKSTISPCVTGFSEIVSDSRKCSTESLFVAIRGERVDGHQYLENAYEAGARGFLVEKGKVSLDMDAYSEANEVSFFEVTDTVKAYRALSQKWRKKFRLPVISIVGSMGKTTTKEIVSAVLSEDYDSVLKTQGSENGFLGIPITLLKLRDHHDIAVIEIGIDEPDSMAQHLEVVAPNLTLLTAIGPEHLEKLGSMENVAQEEFSALLDQAKRGGKVFINVDDPEIRKRIPLLLKTTTPNNLFFFTLSATRDEDRQQIKDFVPAGSILFEGIFDPNNNMLSVTTWPVSDLNAEQFLSPLPGYHNAQNLLGALAIGSHLGLSPNQLRAGLSHFSGADGRSQLRELEPQIQVLCDYYNANPPSVKAAIEVLQSLGEKKDQSKKENQTKGRNFICLGDMLELGPEEEKYHRSLASVILGVSIEHVYLFGPRMQSLAEELATHKIPVTHYLDREQLAGDLKKALLPHDRVLIKGSRSMRMEEVWKFLQK